MRHWKRIPVIAWVLGSFFGVPVSRYFSVSVLWPEIVVVDFDGTAEFIPLRGHGIYSGIHPRRREFDSPSNMSWVIDRC
jgi:hypothetical protein